jgi:hypothetical protein
MSLSSAALPGGYQQVLPVHDHRPRTAIVALGKLCEIAVKCRNPIGTLDDVPVSHDGGAVARLEVVAELLGTGEPVDLIVCLCAVKSGTG